MKRALFFSFLIIFSIMVFTINLEKSKELFLYYIQNFDNPSDEFLLTVKKSIDKDLPLYRFYKIALVGSVEKTDVTKKVGDYLNVIYKQTISKDYNEQLARAMFFSYLESSLERKKFEPSFIKSSPNFNQFFNKYQSKVIFASRNFISDLFAKHLGAKIDLPHDIAAPYYTYEFKYTPKFNQPEFSDEIKILLNNEEIKSKFNEYLGEIKKHPDRLSYYINRYTSLMQRNIIKDISNLKNHFSEYFAKLPPKKTNFWWIRWIIYVLIILIFFKSRKWNYVILTISIVEILYLFLAFDVLSNTDATIYGLIAFFALIASIFITLKNKKIFDIIIVSLLVLSFFIPAFSTKDLLMKNQKDFQNSIYFDELTSDVLKDKYSRFSNIITNLLTIVNSSINNTESIVNRIKINLNEIDKNVKTAEYKSIENFDNRIKDFKSLKDELSNYVIEEDINKSQFKRAEKDLEKFSNKIAKLSSEKFEKLFVSELKRRLNLEEIAPSVRKLEKIISNTKDKNSLKIYFYKTKFGIITFVLITIGLFLYTLKNKNYFIWIIASILSSILMLITPINYIVQFGVPMLKLNYTFTIPTLFIISILILFNSLKSLPKKG
ncbi:hypothetical protein BG95_01200 [Thermosipho sp. 1063]|uniref:hypothetical protein n=1 Tax=unclassified Thermosipho (in: thermotogales) TaxID=2676525 RepID=UPI0009493065|nr:MULTISPECIES: hypothetical protein [unclassified Thermosipho (in: thermotogales)]ANQ53153.1 hypothetical protein Y592_01205 [Thermosipho sp. 1070]APT71603.1 hypothetical protein BG95_01200 [Thermosipho sp. 1063]OOC45677.1 hypothetical protein XO08_01205 [Thermosipho sp. 1074]